MNGGTHSQGPALAAPALKLHPRCLSCLTLSLSLVGHVEQISLREECSKVLFSTPGGSGGDADRMEFYTGSVDWFVVSFPTT